METEDDTIDLLRVRTYLESVLIQDDIHSFWPPCHYAYTSMRLTYTVLSRDPSNGDNDVDAWQPPMELTFAYHSQVKDQNQDQDQEPNGPSCVFSRPLERLGYSETGSYTSMNALMLAIQDALCIHRWQPHLLMDEHAPLPSSW